MDKSVGRAGTRLLPFVVVAALLLAWALTAAGAAAAAPGPAGPTYTLDQLRTALAGSPGGLQGYFKTVLSGSQISLVPVQILAVADGQNPVDGSSLIFFQITDKTVVAEGGMAEGMSGSPVYLGDPDNPDPDTDPLIGAAAYGGDFTTNGLGLATPIEYMTSIETNYSVAPPDRAMATVGALAAPVLENAGPILPKTSTALAGHPVKAAGGTYGTFVIARSRAVGRTLHPAAGTAVFVPLSAVEIGGLPSTSAAYKRLAADFAKRGVDVRAVGAGGGGDPGFTTDLVGGASVAAVLSSGDFWAAALGTVTYAHDNVVVAFGHPVDLDGPSGLDMANADVFGIWSDSLASYKMFSLGAIRGLFTQDRTYGDAGELGATTPEVPVTASAGIGTATPVTMRSNVPLWVADNPNYGEDLISSACYFAVFKAADAALYPGHATMDSSVTVADASTPGTTYTTTMNNVYDDTFDVSGYAGGDVYDMMSELLSNPNGTAPAQMATTPGAVSFNATLTPTDAMLQVLDFSVPGGLKHGANTVRVTVRAYGEKGTREEDLSLFLPTTVATTGSLTVYDSNGLSSGPTDWSDGFAPLDTATSSSETLPDLVGTVEGWLLNDSLNATFVADVPNQFEVPVGPDGQPANYVTTSRTLIEHGTTWFVQGNVAKESAYLRLRPGARTARRGQAVRLHGTMDADDATGTTVALYRGSSTKAFTHVTVHVDPSGEAYFTVRVKMGASTTRFRAVWGGSAGYLGDTATCTVRRVR